MKRTRFLSVALTLCLTLLLLAEVSMGSAQATPTLRSLAERSDFYVGAAVYTSHLRDPIHVETLSREFNMLTPENEAKACEVQPRQGQFDFRNFDTLVAFAEEHDMSIHGHTLVWHACMPNWVVPEAFNREQAIQLLRDHIMTVVGRYQGRVPIWDVVNEGIDDNAQIRDTPWRQMIGDDYIELAFQFAHEADPDALLFYNDYNSEGLNRKSDAIYEMVADFVERGVPIHGVGLQTHATLRSVDDDGIAANIQRLGELGLQVQITEMDVKHRGAPDETVLLRQAGDYRRVFDACINSEYCTAFIVWGVTDKLSWLRYPQFFDNPEVAPLLFDDNYQPKPAYFAILDSLARHVGDPPILTDEEVNAMLRGIPVETAAVPPPTRSDPDQLAPDSAAGMIYYAPFPVSITLDGETDDWANVPRVTVNSGPTLPENSDTSMTFAAAADDTNLYFLAEVTDSTLAYGTHDPATEWYMEDSVEFYINATGDLTTSSYQPGVAQIGILAANLTDPDEPLIGGGSSADSQVSVKVVETEDGYRVEASVPLVTDVWAIEPAHLVALGFQVHLNGASNASDRDTKLIWSSLDTEDQSWTNPSVFGQLVFWDSTQETP